MKAAFISHACVSLAHQKKLRALADKGDIELFLIVPRWWREEAGRVELKTKKDLKFTVLALPTLFTGKQFIHFYLNLAGHLKRIDPDIIHVEEEPNSASAFQAVWLKNRMKLRGKVILFTWQNMRQAWRFPDPRFLFYPFFERYTLKNADYIIAGNKEGEKILMERGFRRKIKVLPQFGVDPEEFKKMDVKDLKKKLGLSSPVIGYLGRLVEAKGVRTLLRAAAGLKGDCQLLIIGDGPQKRALMNIAAELGIKDRTLFTGSIGHSEAPLYINCMDILVLPSEQTPNWKEQFGRVLVEAMACEVPVVGSTCGEIPNVIGDGGSVFKEADEGELRKELQRLILDRELRTSLALKGRERVLSRYTTGSVVKETYEVYRSLAGRRTELRCPGCKSPLVKRETKLRCEECQQVFSIINGVPVFASRSPFYETRPFHTHRYEDTPASRAIFIASPMIRFFRRHLTPGKKLLDVGCGGGNTFYARLCETAGIDLNLGSLLEAKEVYDVVAQGDVTQLPFKDETFDFVVSWDFLGHILPEEKNRAISEMCRVLKKGGRMLHYVETAGNNMLETFARKHPDLYQRYFITLDGHCGLESPGRTIKRFRSRGLLPIAEKKSASTFLRYPKEYLKRFDNEYKERSTVVSILVLACRIIRRMKYIDRCVELAVVMVDKVLEIFSSFDDASGIFVCYEKGARKICFVSGAYPPINDGIGDYTAKLLSYLKGEGLQIDLITSREKGVIDEAGRQGGLNIFPVIRKWDLIGAVNILRLIKKKRFDLFHMQFPSSRYRRTVSLSLLPLFVKILSPSTKVVVTLHEFSISYPVNKLRQLLIGLFSDRVVVTDAGGFDQLSKGPGRFLLKKKLATIPIGSNIDPCPQNAAGKEAFLKRFKLDPKTRVISFFGVIHRNKGLETLLRAMAELKNIKPPVFLVLIAELNAGADPYHKRIQDMIDSLDIKDSVYLTGYRSGREVSGFLSISDVCVLPFLDGATLRRGTLMAAFVHGLPVITTRPERHVPEEFIDRSNIFLVPAKDSKALREAINLLAEDSGLRRRIGSAARQLSKKFSWEKITAGHIELYNNLLLEVKAR